MGHQYYRTVRFSDTDAAGVVYFAQILSICHEAYEASLQQSAINVTAFFAPSAIAVPVVHTEAEFRRPLRCGDVAIVELTPQQTSPYGFEVQYQISRKEGTLVATASTRHVCINTASRKHHPLTSELMWWLKNAASPAEADPLD
jgi:1,4-dihydroxy-2-naphthoyl-CoA hydrolase